ncbi:MAG: peptidylprolyl isomerase [Roseomonas sp.]|nr:peptidylprolyl isomerase [Roseomonas sp.]MCA3429924.1 peptidylprolyl isomerase [Roseomonas sp.]MCA3432167.1 peptidylprolyl isomerase [Roseomonas sp.]
MMRAVTFSRKPLLALVLLAALLMHGAPSPALAQASGGSVNSIVAVVNGDVVTRSEIESRRRLLALSAGMAGDTGAQSGDQILRLLVDERLRIQELSRRRILVTDQDIASSVANIESRNGLPPGGVVQNLRRAGIEPRVLYDQIRAQIGWARLLRGMLGEQANISDAEVNEFLAAQRARLGEPEFLVSEIFIPVENPGQEAQVRRFVTDVIQRLRQGVPFPMVAAQFSQSQSAIQGGAMDWMTADRFDPAVANILRQMPEGAISNPIRVPGGFEIVLLRDKRVSGRDMATIMTMRQVFLPFEGQVNPQAPTAQQLAQLQRAQSLSDQARGCEAMDAAARGSPRPADPGPVRLDNITPPELRDLLGSLPIGRATQPIISVDGALIFMVCARETRNMAEANPQQAREILLRDRVELLSRQLQRDLRRRAQIDIRTNNAARPG